MSINPFAVSGLLTGLTSLAMGFFVLLKNRSITLNRLWFLFTCSVAVWGFGGMWIALEKTPLHALLAWRIAFAFGVIWIPILFYHFVTVFCGLKSRRTLVSNYLIGVGFFPIILSSPLFFGGVRYVFSSFYYSVPGSALFYVFCLWWGWLVVYAHYQVFKSYQHSAGLRRNQFKYFFIAFAFSYLTGSLDYLPIFGLDFYPYGNFGIVFYPIIMTYAIVRYRLMDITVVINKGLAYSLIIAAITAPVYLAVYISERATFYSVPPLLASTLVLGCGLWIVFKNNRAAKNLTFGLLSLGIFIWLIGFFMTYSATGTDEAAFWQRIIYIGVVYIPACFYHFSVALLQAKPSCKFILPNYIMSTIFLLMIPTPYLISGQYEYFWGPYPRAGPLHPLFVIYFAWLSLLSLRKLYLGYKASRDSLEATRIKTVFWAFLIGYLASVDFLQSYGFKFYPLGYLFVSLWVMIVTYAIARYRLLDISLLMNKGKILSYVEAVSLGFLSYAVILVLIQVFTGILHYQLAAVLLTIFTIFARLLATLQKRIEGMVGKALFKSRHEAYETLKEFSKAMVSILELPTLVQTILTTLERVLGIKHVSLFLLDNERGIYALAPSNALDSDALKTLSLSAADGLPHYLRHSKSILVREELEHPNSPNVAQALMHSLQALKADVCLPLINKDRLIGFINLGARVNHQIYTEDELNLLIPLAQNAAVALDNAILYADLKRSQTLMRRTDRLRSLETIAGGFAHEIRNPLTSIKTFVQLAPGRKDDGEFIDEFSQVVLEDVHRIERLIHEILDYARYMEPQFVEEDLNDVVASSLYFIEVKSASKSVTIEKELSQHLPPVLLDRQQIKQVLLNLFLNALDAMTEKGRLIVKTHRLVKSGDVWVQIEITDSGSGISPANLEHIFDPFYTTKHESGEREGTGLGLTIVHQIIQEHQGFIEVESAIGRGTTFYVNLRANPLSRTVLKERDDHEKTGSISR